MSETQKKFNNYPLILSWIALSASSFSLVLTANAAFSESATRNDVFPFMAMTAITCASVCNTILIIRNKTAKQIHR